MPKNSKGHLYKGTVSSKQMVPKSINRPNYVGLKEPPKYTGSNVYSEEEIAKVRFASKIAANTLKMIEKFIMPGISTDEIDKICHEYLLKHEAYPSTLEYRGFPKSICTSINEVICHGIPDDTILENGDIVNVDVTAYVDGYHGDTNKTFIVGNANDDVVSLVDRTKIALERGISTAKVGREVNVIGRSIESYAKRFGYGLIRDFTGHGVGKAFHTGLVIPHYDSAPIFNDLIEDGMIFTIEPMLTLGTSNWEMWDDGWTVVTKDRSISAQFEHTILVRESGIEILTLPD